MRWLHCLECHGVRIPTTRRAAYHHGDLRAALLTAGRDALRGGTLDGLSLRELSRELGVTAAAAYRHFRSKEALLEALAIQGFAELREAIHSGVAGSKGAQPLDAAVLSYQHFASHHPALMALMFRPRAKGRGSRRELDEAIGECLAEFVAAAGSAAGGDDPERSIRLAVQAWSVAHGFAVLSEVNALAALDQWMLPGSAELLRPTGGSRR